MISEKHSFLFVHRPKTGGNSIAEALLPYSNDLKTVNKHQDGVNRFDLINEKYGTTKHTALMEFRAVLPDRVFKQLYKFSTIRNPFEWAISYFFSPHRVARGKATRFDRSLFVDFVERRQTLRSFICLSPESGLTDDIDTLLSFERLEPEFRKLCERLDLPSIELNHRNKSHRRPYREYYDSELREMIEKKFYEELEYGNYDF